MSDYDEEAGFGLSHYEAIQNNIKEEPRFTAEEREAMNFLINCTGSAQKWMDMQTLNRSLSAISTVRAMLTASEIADKGKG